MKLDYLIENIEDVPEDLRDNYVKGEEGFVLTAVEEYKTNHPPENIDGLKSALAKERENAKEAARKLREAQAGGIDSEDYERLKKIERQIEEEKAKAAGDYESLKSQLVNQHSEEVNKYKTEIQKVQSANEEYIIKTESMLAISDPEIKGNSLLLLPHVRAMTKVTNEDGVAALRVVDAAGNPRVGPDGAYLGVKDLLKEMRDDKNFAGAFYGSEQSGGGTPPNGSSGGAGGKGGIPGNLKRSEMKDRDKIDFIKENGHEAFMNLPN